MRKKLCIVFTALLCAFCLTACKDNLTKYDANISELRTNLYAAESADYRVTAITGRRENPFVLDGMSGEKQPFTVITVTPAAYTAGKTYSYTAEIGGKQYSGDFLPHPFAESVSVDIPVASEDSQIALTVTCGDKSESLALVSQITPDTLPAEKALDIALGKLAPQLKTMQSGSHLNAEIYVRITENPIDNTGGYFWYVAFVGENQMTYAVLLNSTTGDVCAIRD